MRVTPKKLGMTKSPTGIFFIFQENYRLDRNRSIDSIIENIRLID